MLLSPGRYARLMDGRPRFRFAADRLVSTKVACINNRLLLTLSIFCQPTGKGEAGAPEKHGESSLLLPVLCLRAATANRVYQLEQQQQQQQQDPMRELCFIKTLLGFGFRSHPSAVLSIPTCHGDGFYCFFPLPHTGDLPPVTTVCY